MEMGLSLGSNRGNRLENLQAARDALAALADVSLIAQSSVYETEPVEVSPEYKEMSFLNAVVIIETRRPVEVIADAIHAIEADRGRVRVEDRNAPRPIDIDIIFAGDLSCRSASLRVPHPRWAQRRFVVEPLAEVCPDRVLPEQSESVRHLLLSLPETPKVVLFVREW